jgi:putative MATE family efflux protein
LTDNPAAFRTAAIRIAGYSAISYVVGYSSQLVDIFWVAGISAGAPTAVAFVATFFAVVLTLNEVAGVGSVAVISRAKGSGDSAAATLAIMQTLFLKLVLGVVMVLLFWLFVLYGLPMFDLHQVTAGYIREYAGVIWLSLLLIPLNATLLTTLRIFDKARTTAWISVAALAANAVLTPLLIFGSVAMGGDFAGLGLAGAAWASIIVESLVLVVTFSMLKSSVIGGSLREVQWRCDLPLYRRLLLIGLPVAGVVLLLNIEQMIITSIVVQQPIAISDGFGIGQRIFALLYISTMGVSIGVAVVTGEAIGRGDFQVVAQQTPAVFKSLLTFACWPLAAVFVCAGLVLELFTSNADTIATGAVYLRFMSVAMVFYIAGSVVTGVFEGAGKNIPVLFAAAVVYLLVDFPLLAWVAQYPPVALKWVWGIVLCSVALQSLVLFRLFAGRYWSSSVESASR